MPATPTDPLETSLVSPVTLTYWTRERPVHAVRETYETLHVAMANALLLALAGHRLFAIFDPSDAPGQRTIAAEEMLEYWRLTRMGHFQFWDGSSAGLAIIRRALGFPQHRVAPDRRGWQVHLARWTALGPELGHVEGQEKTGRTPVVSRPVSRDSRMS